MPPSPTKAAKPNVNFCDIKRALFLFELGSSDPSSPFESSLSSPPPPPPPFWSSPPPISPPPPVKSGITSTELSFQLYRLSLISRTIMAKVIASSQSSLLLPQLQPHATLTSRGIKCINNERIISTYYKPVLSKPRNFQLHIHKGITAIPICRASSIDVELPRQQVEILPDFTGGGGDMGGGNDQNGGGGGGDDNNDSKGDEGSDDPNSKRNNALLMSQKFTLGFAALVGLGGIMGFLKSGSQKSLASGGISALLLYYVYTELPKRPVFASSLGLGLSAALLVVMGSRFKKSGKVFPAGVVSLVSLIMTGGYLHGIMKTH